MSIFQKSIINKYIKTLDNDKVNLAFKEFQRFYGNKLRLFDILHLKEENYQEGFLREIFVQALGYTIRPDLNYNLTTEYKNLTDSKKADGAIIKNNSALGVIELKSAKIFNLDTIKNQAFNYKNNQPDCRYVITSNFHYLRFYIDNATEYEEFDLFEMCNDKTYGSTDFKLLYLILSKESIFNDIPLKMKDETKFHEESISDRFYKDYKLFKDAIFENLVKNNLHLDKLTLFKKSQKLLDRFLFVFFAEDCGLCPPNSVQKIIDQWKILKANDAYTPLYSRFQKLFNYLDIGKKFETFEFPAYNGGLFKPDSLLDNENVTIDDAILLEHCPKLSTYDFNTDIDVNILGHIFEHSLNEIEEMERELTLANLETLPKLTTSKRKKDGIFYTPKYITDYIVENTIGRLCKEKQAELTLPNFQTLAKLNKTENKILFAKYQEYKKWLFSLKILDPACGSGAFLNAALDFLINEHKQVDEQISNLTRDKIPLFDTDKTILEQNIFGVDINEESVEITKLSLWLRTAKKDRKLSDLNENIKCGNSLIDNKEIAGEKAFDWNAEFAEIMKNGGFDVVIGNPPYVGEKGNKDVFRPLQKAFKEKYTKNADLIYFFFFKAIDLLKNNGLASFISTNYFLTADSAEILRNELKTKTSIYHLVNFNENKIFQSALGQHNILTFFKKNQNIHNCKIINYLKNNLNFENIEKQDINIENFTTFSNQIFEGKYNFIITSKKFNILRSVFNKIKENSKLIDEICYVNTGFDSSADKVKTQNIKLIKNQKNIKVGQGIFVLKNIELEKLNLENNIIKKCYKSSDIDKYCSIKWQNLNVIYTNKDTKIENYPLIKNHLSKFKEILEYKKNEHHETLPWYSLHRAREIEVFTDTNKIVFPYRSKKNIFSFSDSDFFGSKDILYLRLKDNNFNIKYLLALLNSKLYYNWLYYNGKRKGETLEMYVTPIKQIPIKQLSEIQQNKLVILVDEIISSKSKLADYTELYNEAKKENNFDREIQIKKIINELKIIIKKNIESIDNEIYKLYELTNEEILIVENATN